MPDRRYAVFTESRWSETELSAEEEAALVEQGRLLARGTNRFGEEVEDSTASLVHVRRVSAGRARVQVADAVGMVATPTLQVVVQPKIPRDHFLYLLSRAGVVPRLADQPGVLDDNADLAFLISHWFVAAAERVLEEGLARDYRRHEDEITAVRGRLDVVATARMLSRGRVAVAAEFEEYDFDTALNRLLLHGTRIVSSGLGLPSMLRRRALRVAKRMDGVGRFRHADVHSEVDRRTGYYRDAVLLARQLVKNTGRSLEVGEQTSWSFLIRTPDVIEAAVRHLVAQGCPGVSVTKRSVQLEGTTRTVNPDIVVNYDQAVADIKYKLAASDWRRADLYEVVAFAAALRTDRAALINFRESGSQLAAVGVGDIRVAELSWHVDEGTDPAQAAETLQADFNAWIAPL